MLHQCEVPHLGVDFEAVHRKTQDNNRWDRCPNNLKGNISLNVGTVRFIAFFSTKPNDSNNQGALNNEKQPGADGHHQIKQLINFTGFGGSSHGHQTVVLAIPKADQRNDNANQHGDNRRRNTVHDSNILLWGGLLYKNRIA